MPGRVWFTAAPLLVSYSGILAVGSHWFGPDTAVIDMPVWPLVIFLCAAGGSYLCLCVVLLRTAEPVPSGSVVVLIAAAGLFARLVLFASEPTIEIDYLRYLWDGGVTAAGFNPYQTAPDNILKLPIEHALQQLAKEAGPIFTSIGHAQLTTIYPPLAQAAFALAHWIQPWSLEAWRFVILIFDIATFILLLRLLHVLAAPLTWSAIYWWNPLVLKELFNSAHMDVLITPFILLALLAAYRSKPLLATVAICAAAGIKVWPVILLPLVWRQIFPEPRKLALTIAAAIVCIGLLALPYWFAGLERDAGIIAYSSSWRISAPLYGLIEIAIAAATPDVWPAPLVARLLVGLLVVGLVLFMICRQSFNQQDLLPGVIAIVAAIIFLSPAVYPWYVTWLLPLLALRPQFPLLLLTATAPLYYTRFYYGARETYEIFELYIVWCLWVPVWIFCMWQWLRPQSGAWLNTQQR